MRALLAVFSVSFAHSQRKARMQLRARQLGSSGQCQTRPTLPKVPIYPAPISSHTSPMAAPASISLKCSAAQQAQQQTAAPAVKAEGQVPGMTAFLDSLKYDKDGLVAVIAQVRTTHGALTAVRAPSKPPMPGEGSCSRRSDAPSPTRRQAIHTHIAHQALLEVPAVCLWCAQHVDTGDVLMQAFADRAAISETLQTK